MVSLLKRPLEFIMDVTFQTKEESSAIIKWCLTNDVAFHKYEGAPQFKIQFLPQQKSLITMFTTQFQTQIVWTNFKTEELYE